MKQKQHVKNSLMTEILIKKIQTQMSNYFSHKTTLTKPETRCQGNDFGNTKV